MFAADPFSWLHKFYIDKLKLILCWVVVVDGHFFIKVFTKVIGEVLFSFWCLFAKLSEPSDECLHLLRSHLLVTVCDVVFVKALCAETLQTGVLVHGHDLFVVV